MVVMMQHQVMDLAPAVQAAVAMEDLVALVLMAPLTQVVVVAAAAKMGRPVVLPEMLAAQAAPA